MPASRMTSTSCQRFSRGEPGTFVWASSSTSATVGCAGDDRVGVHLLDDDAAVLDPPARNDLEAVEQLRRVAAGRAARRTRRRGRSRARRGGGPPRASGTSCRRRAPCRGRRAAGRGRSRPPPGRARASRRPWADVERVPVGTRSSASSASSPSRSRLSRRTLTAGSPEEAEERLLGVARDGRPNLVLGDARGPRRPARPGTRPPPG